MNNGTVFFNDEEYCKRCNTNTPVEEKIQTFKNGIDHLRVSCIECNSFIRYKQQQLKTKYVFPFGKHKGKTLEEAPVNYLYWLLDQDWVKDNLKTAIDDII